MSYENQLIRPTYEQLLKQVRTLRDELAMMKRKYDDLFYNLDIDNFENPKIFADQIITKEVLAEKISSETIVTETIAAYYGDIAELTVDWIDTSRRISRYLLGDTSDMYYFEGHEQKLTFIHALVLTDGNGEPLTEHLKNRYGYPMYWEKDISEAKLDKHGVPYIDKIRVAVTLKDTGIPVIVYVYEPQLTKLALAFTPEKTAVPMIMMGAGTGEDNNGKLMMYKDIDGPVFVYKTKDGKDAALYALDDGFWYVNGKKIGSGGAINDVQISADTTWSSAKINELMGIPNDILEAALYGGV